MRRRFEATRVSRIVGLAIACVAVLYASRAGAYARAESNWNPARLPVSYRVNSASAPSSIGAAGARAAVDAGFASWAAPTCTSFRATNAGDTSVVRGSTRDGENSVLWISGAWPAELGDVRVTIGVTTPVWIVGGYYTDADIQFNNVGFTWSVDGRAGTVDTQSIAAHEEGHFLGLNHSSLSSAVMYASYRGGLLRTLSMDDINGVCAIYPSGGPVPDAGTPTDPCGSYGSCSGCTPNAGCGWCGAAARCMSGSMSGPTGASCAGGWAWFPAECASVPMDAGTTDPCSRFASCGTCTPVSGCGWCGASRQCVSGTSTGPRFGTCSSGYAWLPTECTDGTGGTSSFGEPCSTPRDCASGGYCVVAGGSAFCSRACTSDCGCPRGYRCAATTTPGLSVCGPGTNTCPPPVMDAGTPPPDVMTPPADTGTRVDAMNPPDVPRADGSVLPDAAESDVVDPADVDDARASRRPPVMEPGCACRSSRENRSSSRFALVGIGLGFAVAIRRRRGCGHRRAAGPRT